MSDTDDTAQDEDSEGSTTIVIEDGSSMGSMFSNDKEEGDYDKIACGVDSVTTMSTNQ